MAHGMSRSPAHDSAVRRKSRARCSTPSTVFTDSVDVQYRKLVQNLNKRELGPVHAPQTNPDVTDCTAKLRIGSKVRGCNKHVTFLPMIQSTID